MLHTVAVVTAIYENYTILEDFITSFEKQTDRDFIIILVDSSKNKKKPTLPSFVHYVMSENKGYAHAINIGIQEAEKKGLTLFSVINSDTYVQKDFISNARKTITDHPSSIIGGKIYYAKGYEYHKDRYENKDLGRVLWYAGGYTDWNHATSFHTHVDEIDTFNETFHKTDFITGCLIMYDKTVLDKVGPWDESYFLYYEDADYCERAKRNGIKLYYDPSVVIWHKNAQSTGGAGSSLHTQYQKRNLLKFGLKYAPLRTKLHLLKNYFL